MVQTTLLLILIALVGSSFCIDCSRNIDTDKDEYKLRRKLFCDNPYDPLVRPVAKREDKITVNISLDLKYLDLDDYNNHFWVHSWVVTKWVDNELKWDPSQYGNIKYIQVSSDAIWLPDLSIFNSDMSQIMLYASTDCVVMSNGNVKCAPDLKAPMYCDLQLQNWPYDTQNCSLYIGSWANAGEIIDVALEKKGVNKYSYMNSNAWELLNITPSRKAYTYANNVSYPFIKYEFKLKRHAALYAASIVGPAFVLAGLTMLSFLIDNLATRCVICCASLLAEALFLQYVGFHLASDGDTSPKIVAYYRDSLLMNLIALLVAILVDQMRAAGEGGCSDLCGGEAPNWLVGAASFVRGRGGKAGQLLLGDQDIEQQADDSSDVLTPRESEKRGIPMCKMFATFVDRICFLVFGIVYLVLLFALVP